DEGDVNATEEEQKEYDDFVSGALELLYRDGEVNPYILGLLDDDPADIRELFGELVTDEMWAQDSRTIALAAAAVVVVLE
ncbi:hypothetical protein NL455_29535, partial [Klebsiella pneumoniae]|nr:hypothetical protein [Klebsiella pneumoniae]